MTDRDSASRRGSVIELILVLSPWRLSFAWHPLTLLNDFRV